jgi:hypothetical protein
MAAVTPLALDSKTILSTLRWNASSGSDTRVETPELESENSLSVGRGNSPYLEARTSAYVRIAAPEV